MKNLFVLKIGGSVITDKKNGLPQAKKAVIKRIAQEIKRAEDEKDFSLILVHGAGSFGHPRAKKYKLWQGLFDKKQALQFCLNGVDDLSINKIVLEILLKEKLMVFPVQPSAVIIQSNKKLKTFDTDAIKILLANNFIPVLYGNVVLDLKLRGSICSGDTIATYLARSLGAQKVFFATDVNGIFDKDPNLYPEAQLVREINKKNFSQIFPGVGKSAAKTDAGGGMRGKLLEIRDQISGIPVFIFNGLTPGNIERSLRGERQGTTIQF